MKLAETVRSRWALALVSVAFGATAIIAASQTCSKPAVAKSVAPVKAWRGCHQRKAVPRPTPVQQQAPTASGSDYRDVLMTARPAFESCTKGQPEGVTYNIRMPIGGDGHVMSVEVRGTSPQLSKVSMKVVKCLETAVVKLQFPATGEQSMVSASIETTLPTK